ncbi:SUMF1/EgtB/PvdO family nonheme iron enzyme [Paenibacillus sp. GSMTC-2017]|uniref:formylglycine-generating enzyme family protein n=1 Tax=Paenibacillus sp. GSMTC-2017 TaxID=2794350 RepID=UPI0018D88B15|nr:SUMF1/EgtB/PvdO family nonheme iron enzyme [Paenibacillus sp. GSMTC-2017]MBH5316196.1 SUMF1/EgtB/PvdO family nonheme iron enzyme [Paenibacillus sp. GSMTC-2017]
MKQIPGGIVEMRDDRKKSNWTADIKPFLLSPFPVTLEQYFAITNKAPISTDNNQKPVVNVSWNEVILICNLLSQRDGLQECYTFNTEREKVICNWEADGYRLPSEAEWQYACKAGSIGYTYGELDQIAWYRDNSDGQTQQVGTKEANAWGLYDMLGNVWEWCWDLYDERVYGTYRIFRGGSWAEAERGCGSTCRRRSHPSFCIDDLGFRLARSIRTFD